MIGKIFRAIIWLITLPFRYFWLGLTTVIMATALGEFFAPDPEDIPVADTLQKVASEPKDALAATLTHLDALRKHLTRGVFALFITSGLAFIFFEQLMQWLVAPIGGLSFLEAKEVTEPVRVYMRVGLMTGLALALPYILFELMRFIVPGISRRARIMGLLAIPFATLFFGVGIWFSYAYMLPSAVKFLVSFYDIPTKPTLTSYVQFATGFMFGTGVAFQLPLISYTLAAMKVLPARILRENWRVAFVVLALVAAVITPTPDAGTMMIVMLPLWALYAVSIVMAYIGQGASRRAKKT